jgi:hypothetical protein
VIPNTRSICRYQTLIFDPGVNCRGNAILLTRASDAVRRTAVVAQGALSGCTDQITPAVAVIHWPLQRAAMLNLRAVDGGRVTPGAEAFNAFAGTLFGGRS